MPTIRRTSSPLRVHLARITLASVLATCLALGLVLTSGSTAVAAGDTTPPTLTVDAGTPTSGIWYADQVIVKLSAQDPEGGTGIFSLRWLLTGAQNGSGSVSTPEQLWTFPELVTQVVVTAEGVSHLTAGADDFAGNPVFATVDIGIDLTNPAITTSLADGFRVEQNAAVSVQYSCTDAHSGVHTCNGPTPTGSHLDTATLGDHTYAIDATDNVGHTTRLTRHYTVIPARSEPGPGPGTITGTLDVVGTTRAGARLAMTTTFAPRPTSVRYQWSTDDGVDLGNTAALVVPASAVGHRIIARATAEANGYPRRVLSETTAVVSKAEATISASAFARGHRRVLVRLLVATPVVEPSGNVVIKRGARMVARRALDSNGRLSLTLSKQRRGRTCYTIVYTGSDAITAASVRTQKIVVS